ncbi:MAG: VOC family protein [Planctomycetales bacterium]|nr:VOC family protein [bacterium]UNM09664.1 MAG: VOC family protein [Planctomycetales bacterium]
MAFHIDWIEFASADNKALSEFYGGLFGWKMQSFMPGYDVWMPDSGPGGGFRENCPEGTPQTVVYVNVDDIDAALVKVAQLGGTVVVPKMEISPDVGWSAFFKDPSGNIVGLHQNPAAQ